MASVTATLGLVQEETDILTRAWQEDTDKKTAEHRGGWGDLSTFVSREILDPALATVINAGLERNTLINSVKDAAPRATVPQLRAAFQAMAPIVQETRTMTDKLMLILLGVFLLLFGIFSVTNLQLEWGKPLMGFSALAAGIVCLVRAIR